MQHWKSTLKGMEPQSTAKTYSIGLCLPLVINNKAWFHSQLDSPDLSLQDQQPCRAIFLAEKHP